MRRTWLSIAAISALALTACDDNGGDEEIEGVDSDELSSDTVISYNTPTEWANWGEVLADFSDRTGVSAPNDPKNSGQALAALEAEADSPVADVVYYGIVFGLEAVESELVEPFEPEYFDEIDDDLKDPDANWFAVHQGAVAMLVNTDEIGDADVPKCWEDLTDPAYEGMVGYLDPSQAAVGYSVLTSANLALGGDFEDFEPGLEWAEAMAQNGVVNPAQTATASVQQGEIPILIDADFNGYQLAEEGSPIEVVYPCEGSLSIPYTMSLVADAPHPDAGEALLNYVLSDEAQALFAEGYLRPVRDVDLPAEVEEAFPDDYEEIVEGADFEAMNDVQDDMVSDFEQRAR